MSVAPIQFAKLRIYNEYSYAVRRVVMFVYILLTKQICIMLESGYFNTSFLASYE